MMNIRFFTHATSLDNESGICSGHNDVALSIKGLEQARRNAIDCEIFAFDEVYCSGLVRSLWTAEILFPKYVAVSTVDLNEMNYGQLNGAAVCDFPIDEFECIKNRFHNGENCLDVEARMQRFLAQVGGADIAIVGHKYSQLALEVIYNGLPWEQAIVQDWRKRGEWQLS